MAERICSIEGCERKHSGRGWCHKHYMQWYQTGDPIAARAWHPTGAEHPLWTGQNASYATAHSRLRDRRGKASLHLCEHCGVRARDWAYDHTDPDERTQEWYGKTVVYSTDTDRYIPLCRSCHTKFDQKGGGVTWPARTK